MHPTGREGSSCSWHAVRDLGCSRCSAPAPPRSAGSEAWARGPGRGATRSWTGQSGGRTLREFLAHQRAHRLVATQRPVRRPLVPRVGTAVVRDVSQSFVQCPGPGVAFFHAELGVAEATVPHPEFRRFDEEGADPARLQSRVDSQLPEGADALLDPVVDLRPSRRERPWECRPRGSRPRRAGHAPAASRRLPGGVRTPTTRRTRGRHAPGRAPTASTPRWSSSSPPASQHPCGPPGMQCRSSERAPTSLPHAGSSECHVGGPSAARRGTNLSSFVTLCIRT